MSGFNLRIIFVIAVLSIIAPNQFEAQENTLPVMSFNIRYDNPKDGVNAWPNRKKAVCSLIKKYKPAIIGIQEALENQNADLLNGVQGYSMVGLGREDGDAKGEYCSILFDTTRMNCLWDSTFWLSDTPHRISRGWDAALERIATVGLFADKTSEKKLYVINAHFDHKGKKARYESARLLTSFAAEIGESGIPVVLTGDLNCVPESRPLKQLLSLFDDPSVVTGEALTPKGTFNGFDPELRPDKRIDYILLFGLMPLQYRHLIERRTERLFVSDHYPVICQIMWN